ncbi:type VI secretion system tube protein Hcp [Bauldia sp.]|uniref:type VI secretion system tube protein Hcp n=1 Tax=Bauldia sp. TaxID=2575872 RepID=UPI003BAC54CC
MDLILLQPGKPELVRSPFRPDRALVTVNGSPIRQVLEDGPCIELLSIDQGIARFGEADASSAAQTPGKPVVIDLTGVKHVDNNSAAFYESCRRATPLDAADGAPTRIHIFAMSDDAIARAMTYTLRDALISEIAVQPRGNDMATERFKLCAAEITWAYDDESQAEPTSTVWRNVPGQAALTALGN